MKDLSTFQAPRISKVQIRAEADSFRAKYNPSGDLPIDIQAIIEFDLDIRIRTVPGLQESCDIDALLLGDNRTIAVDHKMYMDERFANRLRFSLAHEVGHKVLHPGLYGQVDHASVEEWIQSFQSIPEDQYSWIEQHAYEFAGRLLVPVDRLKKELAQTVSRAKTAGFTSWDKSGDAALSYIAGSISRSFGVSSQVIEKRVRSESLWPPATTLPAAKNAAAP